MSDRYMQLAAIAAGVRRSDLLVRRWFTIAQAHR
jgi:hypothetical protein